MDPVTRWQIIQSDGKSFLNDLPSNVIKGVRALRGIFGPLWSQKL